MNVDFTNFAVRLPGLSGVTRMPPPQTFFQGPAHWYWTFFIRREAAPLRKFNVNVNLIRRLR